MKKLEIATGTYKQKDTNKHIILIYQGGLICATLQIKKDYTIKKKIRKITDVAKYLYDNDYEYVEQDK